MVCVDAIKRTIVNGAEQGMEDQIRRLGLADPGNGDVIERLSKMSSLVTYPVGTLIFSEGELHDRLYFVAHGAVSLEMVTTNCGQKRILTTGTGDLLAWSGLLGDGRMTATAVAIEPTELIEFPAATLRSLCESNHDVGYVVMLRVAKALSHRLLATRLQLLDLYHIENS